MSMEAIERITQVEKDCQERKAAAEAEAKKRIADAKQQGAALLQQIRNVAAEEGKRMLQAAETQAEGRTAQIQKEAEENAQALREAAAGQLETAAELIVGRVVKQ